MSRDHVFFATLLLSLDAVAKSTDLLSKTGWTKHERTSIALDKPDESSRMYSSMSRLTYRVVPSHYNLFIEPDLDHQNFTGAVEIDVKVRAPHASDHYSRRHSPYKSPKANQIVLNAEDWLQIQDVWYMEINAQDQVQSEVKVESFSFGFDEGILVLNLERDLVDGSSGKLYLVFSGPINGGDDGLIRGEYRTSNGEKRYYAATNFRQFRSREVFPCFDHPAFQTTFNINLLTSAQQSALSDGDMISEEIDGDKKLVRFAQTPPMRTHLITFVVGEFDRIEQRDPSGKFDIRLYTLSGIEQKFDHALDKAFRVIAILQDNFGGEYPLKELNLVLLPDFKGEEKDDWGLIILSDSVESLERPRGKASFAKYLVHELVRMWFDRLVTSNLAYIGHKMEFKNWLEFNLTSSIAQDFDFATYYLSEVHIPALKLNSEVRPYKMQYASFEMPDVETDAIEYDKSMAALRSLNDDLLKPKTLREAIQDFLAPEDNKESTEFWHSIESGSGFPARKFIDSWSIQEGYPVVKVSLVDHANSRKLLLRQERFFNGPVFNYNEDQFWNIPVTVIFSDGKNQQESLSILMDESLEDRATSLKLPSWFSTKKPGHWFKLNAGFKGFYRVQYVTEQALDAWEGAIREKNMSRIDRLNVLDDAIALTRASRVSGAHLLKIVSWFDEEDDGAVIEMLSNAYRLLVDMSKGKSFERKLKLFATQFFGKIFNHLRLDGLVREGYANMQERVSVLDVLLDVGHKESIDELLELFRSSKSIDPILKHAIFRAVAQYGSDEDFEELKCLLEDSRSVQNERDLILFAMTKANSVDKLGTVWKWLENEKNKFKTNQGTNILSSMTSTESGVKFLKSLLNYNQYYTSLVYIDLDTLLIRLAISVGRRRFSRLEREFKKYDLDFNWYELEGNVNYNVPTMNSKDSSLFEQYLDEEIELLNHN